VPRSGNTLPFPPSFRWRSHRRVRVHVRTKAVPVAGSSGFRMNKHCLNRDSGSPGALCAPVPSRLPVHHFTVVPLRNSWLYFRLLRSAHRRATGALTLFEGRRTFLCSWLARLRGSTLISRRFATARSPLFFPSLLSSLSLSFPPSIWLFEEARWCN